MIDALNTSLAQRLDIFCYRGEVCKHTINVKNADGSNYDFSTISGTDDICRLIVTKGDQFPLTATSIVTINPGVMPSYWGSASNEYFSPGVGNNDIEDGKITFDIDTGLGIWPDVYEYFIMTRPNEGGNYANKYWLYGKFTVKEINPYSADFTW